MNATIIFGSKKLGQTQEKASNEKYPDLAVVTVEGQKGAKKSRRILLNTKAAELLNLESGAVQEVVFASVEVNETNERGILIANRSALPYGEEAGEMVTYKTSKNKVSFGEDTAEKGKAVTSSHMCNEIFTFLGKDDSANIEFQLDAVEDQTIDAYSLNPVGSVQPVNETIETNAGEMTTEEVVGSVQEQVAQDEAADPIFGSEESAPASVETPVTADDWA